MLRKSINLFLLALIILTFNIVSAIDEATELQGKIAIIGSDYNVYTYDGATENLTQLSDDAATIGRYEWTTWSNDGRLAYFCCQNQPIGQAYISSDGVSEPRLAYENQGSLVIYASWSPADCGENCRELAMLVNNSNGLALDVLTDDETSSITTIGTGNPYYYQWDSTGTQMIFHRFNRELEIYNRAQNDIVQALEPSSGAFQAPIWSPIDDRVLVGLYGSSERLTNLATIDNGEINVLVEDISGALSFLWSPDGRYIAYRVIDQFGYGGINVIDANTGEVLSVADNTGTTAFFWSPDSKKIAYLTLESEDDATRSASAGIRVSNDFIQDALPTYLRWHVLNIEAETKLSYSSFLPTYEFVYLAQYFDQFAPSHQLWSPDSRYLVYAGGTSDTQATPQIYVLDTEDQQAEPLAIKDGVFGIWSFE